ncbi:MAG: hypothetical protein Q4P20_06645 [Eubacteriales bacterium]|nr:hypothetical protein [Eubacteriales bacterium]
METSEAMEAATETTATEATDAAQPVVKTADTAQTEPKPVIKLVYIGPSIPRSKLRNGQILSGTEAEIMEFIGGMSEEYAEIKYLLVEPKKLSDAQAKTQEKGNILHKYYQDMAAKARTSRRR